jgi:AraC-like DNA-binding protein
MSSTTLSSWARLVWEELQQRRLDARAIFAAAGLDPAELQDSNARFPAERMSHLWQLSEEKSGDPAIGVAIGMRWNPTTFHALGYAWLASATLAQAFHRLARYSRLINDASEFTLTTTGTNYRVTGTVRDPGFILSPIAIQATAVAIVKMCRTVSGESFSPVEVQFPFAPTASTLALEVNLRAPLRFGCDVAGMLIDRQDMERPLPTSNPELSRSSEEIAMKYLGRLDQRQLAQQVRRRIVEALPSGRIKEEDIATSLHLSTRTLQRRLIEEGVNFGELLQGVRRELAQNYIDDSQLNVSEIAYLLGFSDQANFTRAFKRWFGATPSDWRRRKISGR